MNRHSDEETIGFVGIGTIGFQIAENLVTSGYRVAAYDVDDEALEAFCEVGGERVDTPRELGEISKSVHLVVANDEQAEGAVYGDDGIFAGLDASASESIKRLIVHSTLVPSTVVDFAENAPDGVEVIDAAVSGTDGDSTREGEITVMLGGDREAIEGYRSVLDVISKKTIHLGPVGSGLTAKLTNNAIHHAVEAVTLEALEVGTEYGLDQEQLLEVIRSSSGDTYFAQNFEYFTEDVLLKKPDDPHWFAYNIKKNMTQVLELSDEVDVDVPVMGHVSQETPRWFKQLADDLESE